MFKNRDADAKVDLLRSTGPFGACDRRDLQRVARLVTLFDVPSNRVLMRQGAVGHECFVIVHGHARVQRNGTPIGTIDDGQVVGELALIDYKPRTGTVVTASATTLFVMSQREFATLRQLSIPSVQSYLDAVAETRRRRLHAAVGAQPVEQHR
jgi:CRP-like cAMP-binding protein